MGNSDHATVIAVSLKPDPVLAGCEKRSISKTLQTNTDGSSSQNLSEVVTSIYNFLAYYLHLYPFKKILTLPSSGMFSEQKVKKESWFRSR